MAPPRRWIRLDVGWSDSEWVGGLEPAARLSWVELLAYAKRDGVGGVVKALTAAAFARKIRVPEDAVAAMIEAASADGALIVADGEWIVANWPDYQETDPGAAERMRRYRESKSQHSPLRRNTRNVTRTPVTPRNVTRNPSRDRDRDKQKRDAKASPSDRRSDAAAIDQVYAHWVRRTGRDPERVRLTSARRAKIATRLKTFTVEQLTQAIDGVMLSEHHRKKQEWTDLVSCFGSDEKVENHIARAAKSKNGASPDRPAGERKQELAEALAMVRRQNPGFGGGLPDLWRDSFELPRNRRDYELWNELLCEAGLAPIDMERSE